MHHTRQYNSNTKGCCRYLFNTVENWNTEKSAASEHENWHSVTWVVGRKAQ